MRLANKTALVTGAGQGFGLGIAETFAREGAKVAFLDLNESAAKEAAAKIGGSAIALGCDVSNGAQVERAVAETIRAFGRLDIIVNNAGTSHRNKPMLEVTEEEYDRVFAVNVKSIYLITRAVLPHFRQIGGGNILNIGSTAGLRPRPGLTWYNASKGAVNLLSKSLAVELGPDRIRVNAICPVIGETGLLEKFMGVPDTPQNRAKFLATIPLGRMCRPSDVAAAAVYLGSDAAEFI